MIVSEDKKHAIVGHYTVLSKPSDIYHRFKLKGLDENLCYEVEQKKTTHYGDELMNIGIILSKDYSDNEAEYWIRISRIEEILRQAIFILRAK